MEVVDNRTYRPLDIMLALPLQRLAKYHLLFTVGDANQLPRGMFADSASENLRQHALRSSRF